jgi:putative ABC transport system permease protein
MKLSSVRYIYEIWLGARAVRVQECFAVLGIAVGVALLFASQVASTSLTRSAAQLNTQLVGSAQVQLDARGPEGFGEGLLAQVRRLSGVRVALPIIERQVNVIGTGGERSVDLIGVDPYSVHASGSLLRRFSAHQLVSLRAIALPEPLADEIGAGPLVEVKLEIGARRVETLLAATLGASTIGGLLHSPIAVASIGYVQRLADAPGQITRIFVRYDPAHASQTRAALARLAARWDVNLVPGSFDSRLFAVAVAPESESETLFSSISALVGFMFALNAMLITVPARRRLIEDLRPYGATREMTVQILLFDAVVIGVLACILGLALGDVLSIAVFHSTPGYLSFAFPVGNSRIVTWQSMALAVTAGMAAAIFGVLWPVREILARPLAGSQHTAVRGRDWSAALLIVGLLCLGITTTILVWDTRAAVLGNVTLGIALFCLLPFLLDALVMIFKRAALVFDGVSAALAVIELQKPQTRVRSFAVAATAAVAVFGIVEFQGTQTNLKNGLDASAHDLGSSADIWVTPSGKSSLLTTITFKPTDVAALAHAPGVSRLGVYRGSFLDWGERRLWVIAPSPDAEHLVPPSQLLDRDSANSNPTLVSARVGQGGWAVLSEALANEHHLRVGDTFTLPSPRPQPMRVAALITNLGWPPGAIIINSEDYARAWASSEPSAYEIQTSPGTPAVIVRDRLRRILGAASGLSVETTGERDQRHYALAAQGLTRLTQIRLLVLIAAILAVVGAMGSMIWQRRDRIASQKCHGYREGVLWRSLLCESAVLLIAGSLIGAIFGLYAQLLGSHFLAVVTGFPVVFDVEGLAAVSSFALVSVIAVVVLAIPGYFVVRVPPSMVSPAY